MCVCVCVYAPVGICTHVCGDLRDAELAMSVCICVCVCVRASECMCICVHVSACVCAYG